MSPDKNIAASVRQRLINLSRERHEEPNLLFIRYAIERFLYRISCSNQSDKFILKGAMLFASWTDTPHRPTKDLDLLGYGDASAEELNKTVIEICKTEVTPDGLEFNLDNIQINEIRADLDYPGQQIKLESWLGTARIQIKIDIGFGDSVIPAPEILEYPTLLDMPSPKIRAYPIETVVAEKLEAMVSRGILNSRMKDFYDLWTLANDFSFDGYSLSKAIEGTFHRRGTPIPENKPVAFSKDFYNNQDKQIQWKAFLRTSRLEDTDLELSQVTGYIYEFLSPPIASILDKAEFEKTWPTGGPWK